MRARNCPPECTFEEDWHQLPCHCGHRGGEHNHVHPHACLHKNPEKLLEVQCHPGCKFYSQNVMLDLLQEVQQFEVNR